MTQIKGAKKKTFHLKLLHQQAFDKMKQLIAYNVILAYPNFELPFQIYTDASDYQYGS